MTPGATANVHEVISSSLRSWIIESLDQFGVDSLVFLHVIQSILEQDIWSLREEDDLWRCRLTPVGSKRATRDSKKPMNKRDLRRCVLLENMKPCFKEEESSFAEEFVDELLCRWNEEIRLKAESYSDVKSCEQCIPDRGNDHGGIGTRDPVKEYYDAFPALVAPVRLAASSQAAHDFRGVTAPNKSRVELLSNFSYLSSLQHRRFESKSPKDMSSDHIKSAKSRREMTDDVFKRGNAVPTAKKHFVESVPMGYLGSVQYSSSGGHRNNQISANRAMSNSGTSFASCQRSSNRKFVSSFPEGNREEKLEKHLRTRGEKCFAPIPANFLYRTIEKIISQGLPSGSSQQGAVGCCTVLSSDSEDASYKCISDNKGSQNFRFPIYMEDEHGTLICIGTDCNLLDGNGNQSVNDKMAVKESKATEKDGFNGCNTQKGDIRFLHGTDDVLQFQPASCADISSCNQLDCPVSDAAGLKFWPTVSGEKTLWMEENQRNVDANARVNLGTQTELNADHDADDAKGCAEVVLGNFLLNGGKFGSRQTLRTLPADPLCVRNSSSEADCFSYGMFTERPTTATSPWCWSGYRAYGVIPCSCHLGAGTQHSDTRNSFENKKENCINKDSMTFEDPDSSNYISYYSCNKLVTVPHKRVRRGTAIHTIEPISRLLAEISERDLMNHIAVTLAPLYPDLLVPQPLYLPEAEMLAFAAVQNYVSDGSRCIMCDNEPGPDLFSSVCEKDYQLYLYLALSRMDVNVDHVLNFRDFCCWRSCILKQTTSDKILPCTCGLCSRAITLFNSRYAFIESSVSACEIKSDSASTSRHLMGETKAETERQKHADIKISGSGLSSELASITDNCFPVFPMDSFNYTSNFYATIFEDASEVENADDGLRFMNSGNFTSEPICDKSSDALGRASVDLREIWSCESAHLVSEERSTFSINQQVEENNNNVFEAFDWDPDSGSWLCRNSIGLGHYIDIWSNSDALITGLSNGASSSSRLFRLEDSDCPRNGSVSSSSMAGECMSPSSTALDRLLSSEEMTSSESLQSDLPEVVYSLLLNDSSSSDHEAILVNRDDSPSDSHCPSISESKSSDTDDALHILNMVWNPDTDADTLSEGALVDKTNLHYGFSEETSEPSLQEPLQRNISQTDYSPADNQAAAEELAGDSKIQFFFGYSYLVPSSQPCSFVPDGTDACLCTSQLQFSDSSGSFESNVSDSSLSRPYSVLLDTSDDVSEEFQRNLSSTETSKSDFKNCKQLPSLPKETKAQHFKRVDCGWDTQEVASENVDSSMPRWEVSQINEASVIHPEESYNEPAVNTYNLKELKYIWDDQELMTDLSENLKVWCWQEPEPERCIESENQEQTEFETLTAKVGKVLVPDNDLAETGLGELKQAQSCWVIEDTNTEQTGCEGQGDGLKNEVESKFTEKLNSFSSENFEALAPCWDAEELDSKDAASCLSVGIPNLEIFKVRSSVCGPGQKESKILKGIVGLSEGRQQNYETVNTELPVWRSNSFDVDDSREHLWHKQEPKSESSTSLALGQNNDTIHANEFATVSFSWDNAAESDSWKQQVDTRTVMSSRSEDLRGLETNLGNFKGLASIWKGKQPETDSIHLMPSCQDQMKTLVSHSKEERAISESLMGYTQSWDNDQGNQPRLQLGTDLQNFDSGNMGDLKCIWEKPSPDSKHVMRSDSSWCLQETKSQNTEESCWNMHQSSAENLKEMPSFQVGKVLKTFVKGNDVEKSDSENIQELTSIWERRELRKNMKELKSEGSKQPQICKSENVKEIHTCVEEKETELENFEKLKFIWQTEESSSETMKEPKSCCWESPESSVLEPLLHVIPTWDMGQSVPENFSVMKSIWNENEPESVNVVDPSISSCWGQNEPESEIADDLPFADWSLEPYLETEDEPSMPSSFEPDGQNETFKDLKAIWEEGVPKTECMKIPNWDSGQADAKNLTGVTSSGDMQGSAENFIAIKSIWEEQPDDTENINGLISCWVQEEPKPHVMQGVTPNWDLSKGEMARAKSECFQVLRQNLESCQHDFQQCKVGTSSGDMRKSNSEIFHGAKFNSDQQLQEYGYFGLAEKQDWPSPNSNNFQGLMANLDLWQSDSSEELKSFISQWDQQQSDSKGFKGLLSDLNRQQGDLAAEWQLAETFTMLKTGDATDEGLWHMVQDNQDTTPKLVPSENTAFQDKIPNRFIYRYAFFDPKDAYYDTATKDVRTEAIRHIYDPGNSIMRQLEDVFDDGQRLHMEESFKYLPNHVFRPIGGRNSGCDSLLSNGTSLGGATDVSDIILQIKTPNPDSLELLEPESPYQPYLGVESETFTPRFRVHKELEKSAQTGEATPPMQNNESVCGMNVILSTMAILD